MSLSKTWLDWETYCSRRFLNRISFTALPAIGAGSHTAFAVHILDRLLLAQCFPRWNLAVANGLLFNAHLGIGLYIFSRRCLSRASVAHRILYSVYGSAMFNFGSVLLFGTGKQLLIKDRLIRIVYGVCASLCFLCVGKYFFEYLDSQVIGLDDGLDGDETEE